MSTRCNIHFCDAPGVIASNIYQHSDGYPDNKHGVVASLARFFAEVGAMLDDPRFHDAEYLAAKFLVWKAESLAYKDHRLDFIGIAPCIDDHGDIEYVYEVICDRRSGAMPRVRWSHAGSDEWNDWKAGDPLPE